MKISHVVHVIMFFMFFILFISVCFGSFQLLKSEMMTSQMTSHTVMSKHHVTFSSQSDGAEVTLCVCVCSRSHILVGTDVFFPPCEDTL